MISELENIGICICLVVNLLWLSFITISDICECIGWKFDDCCVVICDVSIMFHCTAVAATVSDKHVIVNLSCL